VRCAVSKETTDFFLSAQQGTFVRCAVLKQSKPNAQLWKKAQWAQSNLYLLQNHMTYLLLVQ